MTNGTDPSDSMHPTGPTRFTRDELEDAWRRAIGDLEDVRKEHARELKYEVEAERHRICFAWLPVLDGLEGILDDRPDGEPAALIRARSVRDQAVALLASLGFPRDDETGVRFDPQRHEVAELIDDPTLPPGIVVRVLRPGYGKAPGYRLRPAAVVLNRDSADSGA